jgi:hypothetical protein
MPHYALDAALFVLAHAYGHNGYRDNGSYKVEAMVKPELEERRSYGSFETPAFKAEFTRGTRRRVKGIVPEGGRIRSLYSGEPDFAAPGDEFPFLHHPLRKWL